MKNLSLFILLIASTFSLHAQKKSKTEQLADFTFGFGSSQTTLTTGYSKNWNLGKKQRFFIGAGIRLSGAFSEGKIFTSAPASLAKDKANVDSLYGGKSSIYALNAMINLGYHITPKLDLGFNIDVFGFSFGPSRIKLFSGNGTLDVTTAEPTSMNVLLVGNNDRGTLNSEFYLRYKINHKVGIKVAMQHFFTELTTIEKVQTVPVQNDRFRNITDLFSVGVAFLF
jgi:putative salt-induced outer membrane protein YdiY